MEEDGRGTGLSLPQPRRLPHPVVYTRVLTPAQAETEPWLLHPVCLGTLCSPWAVTGLDPLTAACPSMDLTQSFPASAGLK